MGWSMYVFDDEGRQVLVSVLGVPPERVSVAFRGAPDASWGPPGAPIDSDASEAESDPEYPRWPSSAADAIVSELEPDESESGTVFDIADPCPLCGSRLGRPWGTDPRRCPGCGARIRAVTG